MPAPRPSALLAGLLLNAAALAAPACAQQAKPSWVDPPSKAESPKADAPASAASGQAAGKAAPAKPVAGAERAGPSRKSAAAAEPAKPARRIAQEARPAEPAARRARAEAAPRREAPHRPVRLAIRPQPRPEPAAPAAPASDSRVYGWAVAAQDLTQDYFATLSQPNRVSLGTQTRFYADRVVFHGRPMTLAAVIAEKQRFFARWPERRYRARPDSMRTACNAGIATCQVDSMVDFMAINPERGARSQGTVAVRMAVSFAGGRPVIVAETSRVLSRERVAAAGE
ncbi:conserved hypothetical protein [Methylobacterium sp. 4-46]|uniref:hypothetical protein n=1 Tax=unclassified Methylobacterium TaxID=2615210 RepID=UPI000152E6C1|nr:MULTISPECIES: hypothetical protein [Methylobacterium]ACA16993.1 conserved hypothetical protein [Methylobacterium sp. 4-46]WFT82682.1 hypothetical protein QA634_12920 [Methylobacterium nodulans]